MQAQGFGQDGQALPRRRRRAGNNFQSLPENMENMEKIKNQHGLRAYRGSEARYHCCLVSHASKSQYIRLGR
jgi:hypothetical protein